MVCPEITFDLAAMILVGLYEPNPRIAEAVQEKITLSPEINVVRLSNLHNAVDQIPDVLLFSSDRVSGVQTPMIREYKHVPKIGMLDFYDPFAVTMLWIKEGVWWMQKSDRPETIHNVIYSALSGSQIISQDVARWLLKELADHTLSPKVKDLLLKLNKGWSIDKFSWTLNMTRPAVSNYLRRELQVIPQLLMNP